jgi:hypothetical protein
LKNLISSFHKRDNRIFLKFPSLDIRNGSPGAFTATRAMLNYL